MIQATIDDLFDKTVLDKAINSIKKSRTLCGFDGVYAKDIKQIWLINGKDIESKVRDSTYRPYIADAFEIKKRNGKKRNITVPAVTDQVIIRALHIVLQPQYEEVFSKRSYAFRPGIGASDAIRYLKKKMNSGYDCVIKTDIKSCYDTIDHNTLLSILKRDIPDKRICILLERYIKAKYCKFNRVMKMTVGIMQGSSISPLLANIYLNEFDQLMEKGGFQFIRYADDVILLGRNKKEVHRAYAAAKRILENKLHLKLNDDKTVQSLRRGIDFLGYHIGRRSRFGYYKLFVGKDAKDNLMKYALIARKARCDTPENHLSWLGSFNRGWLNYFKYADKKELKKISHIVDQKQTDFFFSHWDKSEGYSINQLKTIQSFVKGFVSMKNWLGEIIGRQSLIK